MLLKRPPYTSIYDRLMAESTRIGIMINDSSSRSCSSSSSSIPQEQPDEPLNMQQFLDFLLMISKSMHDKCTERSGRSCTPEVGCCCVSGLEQYRPELEPAAATFTSTELTAALQPMVKVLAKTAATLLQGGHSQHAFKWIAESFHK